MYPKSVPFYCKGTFFYYLCTQQLTNSIIMKVTQCQTRWYWQTRKEHLFVALYYLTIIMK